ncbi:MAG: hypothetical protein J6V09_00095 [Clostridia bacterium]|nr:hypothetical protein [Clostridia bacterium]
MDDFNTYEYAVEQKGEGRWLVYKILMVTAYVLYAAIYFLIIFKLKIIPLGALIPFTLWIIVHFTWRYVKPDYVYSIEKGIMTFSVSYTPKKKTKKVAFRLSQAEAIAPASDLKDKISGFEPQKSYSALPRAEDPDAYAAIFRDDMGKRSVLYFSATAQALKLIKHYKSDTVIRSTTY